MSVLSSNFCEHQWQFNGTNINALPGSRFLVLTNVQPSQAGDYRVIIDGSFSRLTSQVARLTVETPPQWGEVNFANNVAFATTADRLVRWGHDLLDGSPLSHPPGRGDYQWQFLRGSKLDLLVYSAPAWLPEPRILY